MAVKMTLKHVFNTDADTFWKEVFFDEDYNRRLYMEALKFRGFEILELTKNDDGTVHRRVLTVPEEDAPESIKKLIGGELSYIEEGNYDPTTKRWTYEIVPSKMAGKVSIKGEYWLEPRGDKQVERVCTVDLNVKVPIVGRIAEAFIEKQTRDSYEVAEQFTNSYLKEKGLS